MQSLKTNSIKMFSSKSGKAGIPLKVGVPKGGLGGLFIGAIAVGGGLFVASQILPPAWHWVNEKVAGNHLPESSVSGAGGGASSGGGGGGQTNINIPPDAFIKGKAATVTFLPKDLEANSPGTAHVPLYVYKSQRNADGSYAGKTDFTQLLRDGTVSSSTMTNIKVGDMVDIYGFNATWYVDPVLGYEIKGEAENVAIDVHLAQAASNYQTTCYDKTSATALSAPTATNISRYTVTLGANQEEKIYCELLNNGANAMIWMKAICGGVANDIDSLNLQDYPVGGYSLNDFTKVAVPKNISNTNGRLNATHGSFEYDFCYEYKKGTNEVMKLKNWDSRKFAFTIKAGTTNPSEDVTDLPTNYDLAWLIFKDGQFGKTSDGKTLQLSFYGHDLTEADVGSYEDSTAPFRRHGAVIVGG